MKKKLLFAAAMLLAAVGVNAQTDVTSTYLTNAGFEDCPAFGSGNAAAESGASGIDYAEYGWTLTKKSGWSHSAVFEYGSGGQINGATIPSADPKGNAGKGLAFSQGWGGDNLYLSTTVTLPAGTYTLVAPVYNALSGVTQMTSKIGFVPTNGSSFISTKISYPSNTWTLDIVEFTLPEQTEGQFQVGFQAISGGSGSNAKLIVDGLTLYDGVYNAELIANKEKLEGSSFTNPSADLLINGSFDTANSGWTLTNMGYQANQERPTRYVEKWQSSPLTGSGSATQTVTNLPAGAYILKGTAHTNKDENDGVTLMVNDQSIPVSGTWKEYEIIYNLEEDGNVTVAYNWSGLNSNWIAIDGFSLVYGGPFDQYMEDKETLGHKKDWDDALAAAQAALANDDYSNVSGEELAALQAEVAKEEPTTAQGYDDATAALNTATTAFIEAAPSYNAWQTIVQLVNEAGELQHADQNKKPSIEATISNAADASDNAISLTTALRAYYESHALAEGIDDAVNKTESITNYNATDGNNGWTWTGNKNEPRNNESWFDSEGNTQYMYFDGGNWSGTGWTTTMEQALTLPAGRYLLTVKGRASEEVTLTMSVGEESVELPNVGNAGNVFDRGWCDSSVEFETNGDAVIILIKATTAGYHQWFSVGDFRLMQLEAIEVPMADADDYTALAAAISAADAKTLGFDAGEYAPYNNVEALQALAAAKAINSENPDGNTKEVVTTATSALNAAIWTANTEEVNAIYDGEFANTEANTTSGDINLPGWTKEQGIRLLVKDVEENPGLANTDGKAAVFSWGGTTLTYGEQTGYTLPLNAHEVYELSFKISGWRDGDVANVVTATLDDVSYSLNPSQFVQAINVSEGNPFKEVKFYLTPVADNSILKIYANHHFTVADLKLMKVAGNLAINDDQNYDIMQAGKIDVKLTRTIKEGVNSVVLPFELTADDIAELGGTGAVAYTVSDYDAEKESLKLAEAESVPANTPFFLKATAASTSSFVFDEKTIISGEPTKTVGDVTLVGTYEKIEAVQEGSYILSGGKFYLVNSTVSLKPTRAYVTVPAGAGAKSVLNVEVEDATAIVGVESEVANSEVYDIAGRKVSAPARGLYIANGKKVLVK